MTNNARIFNDFLKKQNLNLNFIDGDDGKTLLEINETLDGGIKVRICVIFDTDEKLIGIYAFDFIGGINPTKRSYLLDLLNEINSKYTYIKFVMNQDSIEVRSFSLFNNNFEPSVIMQMIFNVMDAIKEDYSNIMRIMWS